MMYWPAGKLRKPCTKIMLAAASCIRIPSKEQERSVIRSMRRFAVSTLSLSCAT